MIKPASLLRRLFAPAIRRGSAFGRDEKGTTAIEFAILALPFFTLIYAILETSLVFFAGQILDSAVQDAARLVRTGQAQTANYTADTFQTAICNGLYGIFDCTQLRINVKTVATFADATVTYPTKTGTDCTTTCDWTLQPLYQPGSGGDIVIVQAYYKWKTIVDLPGFNLQNQPGGIRLLGAVRVFKSEPFGCTNCI